MNGEKIMLDLFDLIMANKTARIALGFLLIIVALGGQYWYADWQEKND